MMAGTIATVTAVLVVNVATDPVWIAWIAPTVVITPFIFYWNKKLCRRASKSLFRRLLTQPPHQILRPYIGVAHQQTRHTYGTVPH